MWRRFLFIFFLVGIVGLAFQTKASAAPDIDHHVGLHDRLLLFDYEEVRILDGKMIVPLKKLANYLVAETTENHWLRFHKNDFEIAYEPFTGKTFKDGVEIDWQPINEIDGTLYVSVRFMAEGLGFKVEYISSVRTARIYRDDTKHMAHTDYAKFIKSTLWERNKPNPKKANVYLTFDDGPNKFTTTNQATLKKHNVKGTFFFIGNYMKDHPTIVKKVAADGHYIGSHSMTHNIKAVYRNSTTFINEMSEAAKIIEDITGKEPHLLRVPYGSKPHLTSSMRVQLIKHGYKMWDWTVDSNDWRYTDQQYTTIIKNVQNGVNKAYNTGDRDIVVLLHDSSQTARALPHIIEWLKKEGYDITTYNPTYHVSKNFHRDGSL